MPEISLIEAAVLLAALAIAAPLAKWLGIGSVLGYLLAGVALGPAGLRLVLDDYEATQFLHAAEFGVVLLLFLIGLELRPKRLFAMRAAIFGVGGAQVAVTAVLLAGIAILFGLAWPTAVFAGLALSLSSTAFALQVIEETGELNQRHGRVAFAVLLFQDLAAIPLIALAPLFAVSEMAKGKVQMDAMTALAGLGTIAAVVIVGHFALDRLIRLVAMTRVKEAMTAAALLTVVSVTLVMQRAGLSASLGAFLAGALLAESSYRHQLEADIQPFQGLLLGLFFTAVGMTLNLDLLLSRPFLVLGLVVGLVAIKALVLYRLGRAEGLAEGPSRRLGLALSQGGEFGFVLTAAGLAAGVLAKPTADLLDVVVTLSMAATPLLLKLESRLLPAAPAPEPLYDDLPENQGHVVIAGFGRFGQIVARVLRGKGIAFTALDISPEQIDLVKRFGSNAFYGDASRPEILDAAQTDKARAFVLAIDDVEASLRTAELLRERYPNVPVYARARNRNHAHRLLDLGVKRTRRETFLSALDITRQLLAGLGYSEREASRMVTMFQTHDERRLMDDYQHYTDLEKMQAKARSDAATLEKLFADDAAEQAKIEKQEKENAKPQPRRDKKEQVR
jgi:glutathione-regulated potassium-efflux system protein KefB